MANIEGPGDPGGPGGYSQARDDEGLMWIQRYFLTQLSMTGSWNEACKSISRSTSTAKRWLREDSAFKKAYTEQFGSTKEEIKEMVAAAQERAVGVLIDALGAGDGGFITITCPHEECGEEHSIAIDKKIDWATRMKAVGMIGKITGVVEDKIQHEVSGQVTHLTLTAPEALALARWRHGYGEVPADMVDKFRQMVSQGLIEGPKEESIIEGEFKELPEGG